MHSLAQNHPFVDGNKRVALAATGLLLELNGCTLTARNVEVLALMRRVTAGEWNASEIAAWLKGHSRDASGG
jgi:death-on-curing protein